MLITYCVNNASRYYRWVLRSFRDKDTEAIWHRQRSRRQDGPVERVAWRKLAILDAAETLADLLAPPGNRLEKLTGDRAGQYCIRINQQWRICFVWSDAGPKMWRLLTIMRGGARGKHRVAPAVHPGEILLEEFLTRWV